MVAKKQELVLAENNDPVSGPPAAFSPATGSTLMGLIEFVSDELDQSDCGRTFSLSHVIDNGPDSPMLHRAIGAKLPLEDAKIEAMKLVERYYAEASGHVLNHKLPQRYVFTTYGKDKLPRGTREFTLYPPMASMVGVGGLTETADERGALHQHMRCSQASVLAGYTAHEKSNMLLRDDNRSLRARVSELESRLDTIADRDIARMKAMYEIEKERSENAMLEKQGEKLIAAGMAFAQVGMAQRGIQLPPGMLGDNVEKKKEDVLRKAFLLFDSLRPEQQATWAGCLDPLQVSLLVELGEAVHQFKALMPQKAA